MIWLKYTVSQDKGSLRGGKGKKGGGTGFNEPGGGVSGTGEKGAA